MRDINEIIEQMVQEQALQVDGSRGRNTFDPSVHPHRTRAGEGLVDAIRRRQEHAENRGQVPERGDRAAEIKANAAERAERQAEPDEPSRIERSRRARESEGTRGFPRVYLGSPQQAIHLGVHSDEVMLEGIEEAVGGGDEELGLGGEAPGTYIINIPESGPPTVSPVETITVPVCIGGSLVEREFLVLPESS